VTVRSSFLPSFALAIAISGIFATAQAQTVCHDTPEGRVCSVQQPIVNGTLVSPQVQQDLGLVTVGGGCSGTLVNRFWVLTADHCVTSTATLNGPSALLANLPITAAWSSRTVIPTRLVRNWGGSGLDVALIFLGAGDFGEKTNIQLFFVGDVDTLMTLTKFGRGIFAYASDGSPPVPAQQDGQYRSAVFTPSAASATSYTLPVNASSQVGNGGDSGGPDFATANGITVGIAGVQSSCVWTSRVPGMPNPPVWTWVTGISSCTSAAISTARWDIVQIIQEGRRPCPDSSAACAVLETTSLTLMLH
jgi:hypothetical protein